MPASSHASEFGIESPTGSDASTPVPDWRAEPSLRGLRWRVLLGVLPSCPAPIEALRRAAANARRRYAELRRRLIVDPHAMGNVRRGENLVVNNPLSQDPDSVWGHYFKNAELERTIENDLARLYPEHGSFFHSHACQAMLKRILLVWASSNPQYGYRQGMHEVLAPLVYVLQLDVAHLLEVNRRYEDPFGERFDTPLEEKISSYCMERKQVMASFTFSEDQEWIHRVHPEDVDLVEPDDFGFNLKTMLLGSESYGAEGELGALLSARFLEHDAYSMLDALLKGEGSVALGDYFLGVNEGAMGASDAFMAMYHTLAIVDMPLYMHFVDIGIEPQFFALRWFRVLFGREFNLEMLLHLWDAIFGASNYWTNVVRTGGIEGSDPTTTSSTRVAFLSTFGASMILYLRPTLLAAPDATACLQKLLNFPKHVDVRNLIENVRALQTLLEEPFKAPPSASRNIPHIVQRRRESKHKEGFTSSFVRSLVLQHGTPELRGHPHAESYWEEKWMTSVPSEDLSVVRSADVTPTHNGSSSNINNGGIEGSKAVEDKHPQQDLMWSNSMLLVENSSKPTARRSLFASIWQSAAQLMSFEEWKVGLPTTSETKPKNPMEDSNRERVNEEGSDGGTPARTEHNPGNEDLTSIASHGSAVSVIWTSDDGETSFSGDDEGKSHTSCSTLDEAREALAHPMEEEVDCLSLSNGCGESCEQFEEEGSMRKDGIGVLSGLREEYGGAQTIQDNEDGGEVINEKRSKALLQTLGHSMVESIQVIEFALSGLSKEGAPIGYWETTENISRALLNGKGRQAALSALAELRKISSLLLQM